MDLDSFEKFLEKMSTVHGIETMLKVTNIIVKIIQEIISEPDNPKYKRIRVAAQVMMYQGAKELLSLFGFRPDKVGHYVLFQDEYAEYIKYWRDRLIEYRKLQGHLDGCELPHKMISFSEMLGRGRFGEVYQGQFEDKPVAIKTIRPDASMVEKEDFKREAEIMSKVSHNNVLKLVGIAFNMDPMLIVLELMNGSILELLQQTNLTNKEVLDRVVQVAAGMEHLHYKNIIHCDLAARNILLDDVGNLKISDFGLSRYAGTAACNVKGQALPFPIRWTSPEVLVSLLLDKPADIWSFGILFFEFCTNGSVPYGDLSNMQTKSKVLSGYRLPRPAGCSDEMYGVMLQCWQSEPVQRPDFKSILETLLPLNLQMVREQKESIGARPPTSEKGRSSKGSTPTDVIGKRAQDYKITESNLSSVLSKGGGLIRVYTANLSEFDSRVVVPCKPRYSVTDVIVLTLIKSGTGNSDPNMYLLAEVVQNIMVPGPKQFNIHILGKEDHPYGISLRWSSQDKGMFYLVHKTAKDNLNEIVNNGSSKHGRTAGYLVKFDENVSGYKQKARDTSLWHRIWCVLDGSTLLCYKNEEEEMLTLTACESYINVAYHKKIEEAEAKRRNHVFRVITKTDDKYLAQANTQDDMNRWIEAIQYNLTESPSKVIQAMGEGEVKKTGYFEINIPSHDTKYGKQWAVLKSTGLMQFFHKAEPKVIGFLQECSKLEMHNPAANNSFCIEAVSGKKTYHLISHTKEDHFEWGDVIHETLQDLGVSDKLKGYSQISQNQGAYIYIKRRLSTKNPVTGPPGTRGHKKSLGESICLPAVIQETSDNYGDFQQEFGMKAMQEQHIIANEPMKRLIQKNSHPYPSHLETIKHSESGESFQSTNSTSSLNENMLPSSSSSSSSGLADSTSQSKYQSSFQSLPVHMHNQLADEGSESRTGFTPPPTADSPPPPPFPNLTGFTFQDLILIQQGDLPPPPDMDTMRKKEKKNSITRKGSNTDSSPDKTPDDRGFTFSQEIRVKADRTSKNFESLSELPDDDPSSLQSQLQSALKRKKVRVSDYAKATVDTNDLELNNEKPRTRLGSEPHRKPNQFVRCSTLNDLDLEAVTQTGKNSAVFSGDETGDSDKDENRKSRDINASIRAAKPFSEKKALIANLFKKEELPLQKGPRPKVQMSSKMEERQKLIKGSMPDFNDPESQDGDSSAKSLKIAKMFEQQKQIQIMAAESRPVQRLQTRPRSQSEFPNSSTQKSAVDSSKSSLYSPKEAPMSPLTKQTFTTTTTPTYIPTTTTPTLIPTAKTPPQQQIPTNVILPPGWKSREENKAMYYFNTLLGVSTWFYDDVVYLYEKSLETPGETWVGFSTEDNTRFFYQPSTGKRTWNIEETRVPPQ